LTKTILHRKENLMHANFSSILEERTRLVFLIGHAQVHF
jgi:hypothetical protein